MNKTLVRSHLTGNMAFESILDGHKVITDAGEDFGGNDLGPRPKGLILSALVGCTGIDIISILKKMKVEIDDLNVEVEATSAEEHPKIYSSIHLTFNFKGKNLPGDKIKKAVSLSQERYCSVTAMLNKAAQITYDIVIDE